MSYRKQFIGKEVHYQVPEDQRPHFVVGRLNLVSGIVTDVLETDESGGALIYAEYLDKSICNKLQSAGKSTQFRIRTANIETDELLHFKDHDTTPTAKDEARFLKVD